MKYFEAIKVRVKPEFDRVLFIKMFHGMEIKHTLVYYYEINFIVYSSECENYNYKRFTSWT